MSKARRILCVPVIVLALLPFGCKSGGGPVGPPGTEPVASVTITTTATSLTVGGTLQLAVVVRDAAGNILANRTKTFASSNGSIATVSAYGVIRALGVGQATITASSEGKSGPVVITVTGIARVDVTPAAPSIVAGETVRLVATPRTATGTAITGCVMGFESANPAVATVAVDGTVTGVATGGPVAITATASCGAGAAGQAQGTANVTVTAPRFTMVAAGAEHTCGLLSNNEIFCWGSNSHGQLGNGTFVSSVTPVRVGGDDPDHRPRFRAVFTGRDFSCGITLGNEALCWGENNMGQLGDGMTVDRADPGAVSGGRRFSTMGLMQESSCALELRGAAFCWGRNDDGQLGDGTTLGKTVPAPVSFGWTYSSLGRSGSGSVNHMCGITTFDFVDGPLLLCWGDNTDGQIGDGTVGTDHLEPIFVVEFAALVAVGEGFTCAGVGSPFCWGRNTSGQLGDGTTTQRSVPTAVATGQTFRLFGLGEGFACALTPAGAAHCWGDNDLGQLGDGTFADHLVPAPVAGGHAFLDLAAGEDHSCAVRTDGVVLCWGRNGAGQLGDGTTADRNVPTPIAPLPN